MRNKIPVGERPLDKLIYYGKNALSNAELMSLVISSGAKGKNAVMLASDVLNASEGGLADLGTMCVSELTKVYGLGEAKAASVIAAVELGRRAQSEKMAKELRSLDGYGIADVAKLLMNDVWGESQERFLVLCLDSKLRILSKDMVSLGTGNTAYVSPRDVFSSAIKRGAAAILAAHNHPSGDPTPSPDDYSITKRLVEAGKIIGITVCDHIILGQGRYFSFNEAGELN